MAYSAPPNFSTGAVLTEAQLDTLSDDITFLANPPKVRVYNSANISITTSGAAQALTFNNEYFDTDTMHSTSVNTSRITFTTAGTYEVGGTVNFASGAGTYRELAIRQNGATILGDVKVPPVSGGATVLTVVTLYQFSAGDYVELVVVQDSGGALNAVAAPNYSPNFFAIWRSL